MICAIYFQPFKTARQLCQFCNRGFAAGGLERHIRTVHRTDQDPTWSCPICMPVHSFNRKDNLKRHMDKQHPDYVALINMSIDSIPISDVAESDCNVFDCDADTIDGLN